MIYHYQPPIVANQHPGSKTIFLAGSIELDTAEKWQKRVIQALEESDKDATIYNPRRDDWDNNIDDGGFRVQVEWELLHLEKADIKAFYFDPNTKSPVTMLELGLMLAAHSDKCIVCSPPGFWRRRNLEITCSNYNVTLLNNFDQFVQEIISKL